MKLIIAGDFCPIHRAEKMLKDGQSIFASELQQNISNADFFIANLECPITDSNNKIQKAGPHLKAGLDISAGLKKLGLDALALANNHIMDYGKKGLMDTCEVLEKNSIKHFGSEIDGKGTNRMTIENSDAKVAILSYSNFEFSIHTDHQKNGAYPIDVMDIVKDMDSIRKEVDHIILLLHTGLDKFPLPSPFQKKLCRFLVDKGASAILCQHSHICGAFEHYSNGFISYGQGSFVFDINKPDETWERGYMVNFDIDQNEFHVSITGICQFGAEPIVRLLDSKEENELNMTLEKFNLALKNEKIYEHYWRSFLQERRSGYYGNILFPNNKWTRRITRRVYLGKLVPNKMKVVWLNLFRNTEHAEVMNEILRRDLDEN